MLEDSIIKSITLIFMIYNESSF